MSGNDKIPYVVVLVSRSPRRRRLLCERGFRMVAVEAPSWVEEVEEGEPGNVVACNARLKVQSFRKAVRDGEPGSDRDLDERFPGCRKVYLGVDTIVEVDGGILGKPSCQDDAVRMLRLLSGRAHRVLSAVYLIDCSGREFSAVRSTVVRFRTLTSEEIDLYLATGEPMDKAGAYGIQGFAGLFIESISGCYYNVVGLPMSTLCEGLSDLGLSLSQVLS